MIDLLVFLSFSALLVFVLVWVNRVDENALRAELTASVADRTPRSPVPAAPDAA